LAFFLRNPHKNCFTISKYEGYGFLYKDHYTEKSEKMRYDESQKTLDFPLEILYNGYRFIQFSKEKRISS